MINALKKYQIDFLEKARKLHPDYSFEKIKYINARTKVEIICSNGHTFWMTPDNFLRGHSCPYCQHLISYTPQEVKEKIAGQYTFRNLNFKNNKSEVILICPKHGEFSIKVFRIMQGFGCQTCARQKGQKSKNNEEYISQLKEKHLDLIYDLSKVNYVNAKTKIILICKKCNKEFLHNPRSILNNFARACPFCHYFLGEEIIKNILTQNKIVFQTQYHFRGTKISRLSFDFFIPSRDILIEYNGAQHYKPIEKWGGEKRFEKQKFNDKRKEEFCKQHNLKLLIISYKDDILTKLKEGGII